MSGTLPPLQQLSPENQGPIVVVVGYILVSVTILCTTIRVVTFHTLKRGFGLDDAYLSFAALMALVQTVLAQRAVDKGLGKKMDLLEDEQIDAYYKYTYAAQMMAIIVMASAKISVVHLIMRLSQRRSRLYTACHIVSGAIAFWTVFSILSLALQCKLPRPWVYSPQKCAGAGALWYPVVVLNLLTDAVLAFLFAPVLWRLKMSRKQRLTITSLFSIRIGVCVAEVFQLALLTHALRAFDQTGSTVDLAVVSQIVMNLSIITAAIPSLHRFLNDLQHGAIGVRITEHQYELSQGSSNGLSGKFQRSKSGASQKNPRSQGSLNAAGSKLSSRIFSDHVTKSANRARANEKKQDRRMPEENSTSSLTNNGVMQTWEISIEVENKNNTDASIATTAESQEYP